MKWTFLAAQFSVAVLALSGTTLYTLSAQAADTVEPELRVISPSRLETRPDSRVGLHPRPTARPAAVPGPAQRDDTDLAAPIAGSQLGLAQAVRLAVEWHPSIAEAIGTLYQQGEGINVARAGYYPRITGGLRGGLDSSYGGNGTSQAVNISLKQMLYDFGKVDSAVDVAKARVARSQAQVLLSIDQVARDTSQAYIEVQRYKRLLEIAREQIKGIAGIADLARQRSDMGAATRSDVVQAKSREDGARATLLQYEALYNRCRANLINLVGRAAPFEVNDDFPSSLLASCNTAEPDMNALPGILVANAQRVEAQAAIRQARVDGLPTLSVDPTLNHYLDSNYNSNNSNIDRTQAGIFINLDVPFYQGGATTARTAAATYALTAADSAEDAARLQARQGLFEAQAQTASLDRRLGSLQYRQTSIVEARELYGQQYLELGTRPLLDLLNAEQEIHQSRFDLANTEADLRRLQVDCLYSTGALRSAYRIDRSTIQGVEILP